ncbi:MAG TPA: MATE family efflux transporter [Cytophagaceae bacterium]|jgi:MATE family multidrug resistance protein
MFSSDFKSYFKRTLLIAFPVCISQLGHIAVGVADSIMAGKLGGIPLAAATLCFSIQVPFLMFGIGISYGATPLISKALGENNQLGISSLLRHSVIMNLLTGIIITIFLYLSAGVLDHLNQNNEVVSAAKPFFQILALSMLPLMVFQSYKQFAEGLAYTNHAMAISISANVLNIFLNYALIFGKWGYPGMGLNGAATATLISRVYMAILMFAFVHFSRHFKLYIEMAKDVKTKADTFLILFRKSLPVGLQLLFETGAFGFAAIMVGWHGSSELAAHQIALNLAAVTYMAATGISSAGAVIVGFEYGSKNYIGIKKAGLTALLFVVILMSVSAVFFIVFRHDLPKFYIDDEEIYKISASLLLIAAFFQLSDGLQVVALGILRGMGNVKLPTTIALFSYWGIALPLGYFLSFKMGYGVEGIWYGLLLGLSLSAGLLLILFFKKSSMKNFNTAVF